MESLNVYCEYSYNYGNAYFDGISLVRRSIEEDLSEEDFLSGEVYDDTYTTSAEDTDVYFITNALNYVQYFTRRNLNAIYC